MTQTSEILTGRPVSASPAVGRLSDRLASGDKLRPVAGEILKKLDRPPDRTGRPACPAGRGQVTLSGRLLVSSGINMVYLRLIKRT